MNRIILILFFLNLILVESSSAQTFWKKYSFSNEGGGSIQETIDHGFIVVSVTSSPVSGTPKGIYIIKLNNSGDTLWTKIIDADDSSMSFATRVLEVSDSNYIIGGDWNINGHLGMCLIKTDFYGNIIWNKAVRPNIGLNHSSSISKTFDDGFILLGASSAVGPILMKTDSSGNVQWIKHFWQVPYKIFPIEIIQSSDSGYVILSMTHVVASAIYNSLIIKTNSIGELLWSKSILDGGCDGSSNIYELSDGGFVFNNFHQLIRTNSFGDTIWTKSYGKNENMILRTFTKYSNGDYLLAGHYSDSSGNFYNTLIKTDTSGNILWTRRYFNPDLFYPSKVKQNTDGTIIISGRSSQSMILPVCIEILKTDSIGNLHMHCPEINTPFLNEYIPITIANYPLTVDSVTDSIFTPSASIFHGTNISEVCINNGIIYNEINNAYSIFPNPTVGKFYIENVEYDFDVAIFNLQGKIYYHKENINSNTEIDISHLSPGLYYCKIISNNNIFSVMKIILQ